MTVHIKIAIKDCSFPACLDHRICSARWFGASALATPSSMRSGPIPGISPEKYVYDFLRTWKFKMIKLYVDYVDVLDTKNHKFSCFMIFFDATFLFLHVKERLVASKRFLARKAPRSFLRSWPRPRKRASPLSSSKSPPAFGEFPSHKRVCLKMVSTPFTQWFCWSWSLWNMAISLGRLTQHFQTNPKGNIQQLMFPGNCTADWLCLFLQVRRGEKLAAPPGAARGD